MSKARIGIVGLLVAGLSAAAFLPTGAGENKAVIESLDKIAASLKKGDKEGAKKDADALAKKIEELNEVMDLMKPRKKGGFGVGEKPGATTPDGIEQMLLKIGRDAPAAGTMKKDGDAYEQMAYRVAAIGLVGHAKAPKTNMGKKTVKDWLTWSDDMVQGSLDLAAAAKSRSGAEVKAAAVKLNNSCNTCHTTFR